MTIYRPKDYSSEYHALRAAVGRCHNSNHQSYHHYGERGIFVCEEWRHQPSGFQAFMNHLGPKPSPDLELDRIDNDKGYEPNNVQWATRSQQCRNTRGMSEATKQKMREATRIRNQNPDYITKLKAARAKQTNTRRGQACSNEHKERVRQGLRLRYYWLVIQG